MVGARHFKIVKLKEMKKNGNFSAFFGFKVNSSDYLNWCIDDQGIGDECSEGIIKNIGEYHYRKRVII